MASPLSLPRTARPLTLMITAAALGFGFSGGRADAAGTPFLAHQALYDLNLVKSRGSNAINSARGRILYNFSRQCLRGLHVRIQAGLRAGKR